MPTAARRVLIFFPHNPYPPRTGAHRVAAEYIAAYRRAGCDVLLASTTMTTDTHWTAESVAKIEREWGARVSVFEADWRERKFIGATGRLLEMRGREPALNSPAHTPPRMRLWFSGLARAFRPDQILMNYAYWDGLLHQASLEGIPRAVCTHDLVTANRKLMDAVRRALPQSPARIDAVPNEALQEEWIASLGLVADREEFAIYDTYDATIALSHSEAAQIEASCSKTATLRIAPTHEIRAVENDYSGPAVYAAGSHALNLLGYAYFARRALPAVRAATPEFSLLVTGGLEAQIADPEPPAGVSFAGMVPDLAEVYRRAAFAVVPVFRGTGVAVKVIEAMAHGVAPLALRQTVEPDLVRHGENCLVADDAQEFAAHVANLWRDRALCRKLGEQARIDAAAYNEAQTRQIESLAGGAFTQRALPR